MLLSIDKMTDPTLSDKREDILPNVVLNGDTSVVDPTAGERLQKQSILALIHHVSQKQRRKMVILFPSLLK